MYRATDKQMSLLGAETGLSQSARKRLNSTWAASYREQVMPVLLATESEFAVLYAKGGRPNWSVARLVGLQLLQQLQNLSDQQAVDALSFDVRFQHALDVAPEDAYLSRRSLVEFRRRLVEHDPDGELMREVFHRICAAGLLDLGLSSAEQRVDSTLIISNIRSRGRISLARETLRVFVHSLNEAQRAQLPEAVRVGYAAMDKSGWENDALDKESRLRELGRLSQATLQAFEHDAVVSTSEPYGLLRRLVDEHGKALGLHGDAVDDSDDEPPTSPENKAPIKRKNANGKTVKTKRHSQGKARYWSPHDPDASYGHKGLGYHVHITETCRNKTTELLTDYAVVTAADCDVGQGLPAIERLAERGLQPQVLYADGGYPTPSDLVKADEMGTNLYAPVHRGRLAVDAYSRADFELDTQANEVVRCPEGQTPTRHGQRESSDSLERRRALFAFFQADKCDACPKLERCPVREPNNKHAHEYRLELSTELLARDARWAQQKTDAWKTPYRIRAGVEATMSELKRAHGLGRLRVRRHPRVLIQVALKATACNIKRWLRALAALLAGLWTLLGGQLASPAVLAAPDDKRFQCA
jgi:Transposase DDE domain/Transposase domain (DUF772)